MILSDNGGGSFKLAPEGSFLAVCVDFVDLGMVESTWQGQTTQKRKCRIVFEARDENDQWFIASRRFTASLNEKAELRKVLESWRGKPFTADELRAFDTESLIGVNAVIGIAHVQKGDRTYDNIQTVMRPMRGMPKLAPSGTYVRVQDRPQNGSAPEGEQRRPPSNATRGDYAMSRTGSGSMNMTTDEPLPEPPEDLF